MKEESRLMLEGFLQFGKKWDTVVNNVKANCQMFDNEHAAFWRTTVFVSLKQRTQDHVGQCH